MQSLMRALELDPELGKDEALLQLTLFLVLNGPDGAAQSHQLACRWNALTAAHLKEAIVPHANTREADRRLRIGYVSPDFRMHPVSYFIESVLMAHDRSKFEVTCYAELAHDPDVVTERLKNQADRWCDTTRMSDDELAACVRADQIDILVDLAGHTGHNRLLVFARKPAPVQVSWIGYPATTGLDTIDWRLTDAIADPPGLTEKFHTEKLWRLPGPFLCFSPQADAPAVSEPPYKRNGFVSFGCFNNGSKIRDPVLAVWARVIKGLSGSRIVVKNRTLSDAVFRKELRDRFRAAGGDPAALVLHGFEPTPTAHLALYAEVDIALDTFPYNGTTTTCEALWMGVPVVTLAGDSHVSRVGVSLLTNAGLGDLVAHTEDEYVSILMTLAGDHERREKLRRSLRDQMLNSPIGDAPLFTRHLEGAYRAMWRQWCDSAPPVH
jgi:predicted O-linked N-acetylglucosamine transferase (SPINDLY family)